MKSKLGFLTTLRSTGQQKYAVEEKDSTPVTNYSVYDLILTHWTATFKRYLKTFFNLFYVVCNH